MKYRLLQNSLMGILLCISCTLAAQNNSTPNNIKLKIYFNGFYEEVEQYKSTADPDKTRKYESKDFDFGTPSFGLEFYGSKRFSHEIEVKQVGFAVQDYLETITESGTDFYQAVGGGIVTTLKLTVCYQLNYYILKERIIMPYIGLSSQFASEFVNIKPKVSVSYPCFEQDYGILLAISPGVEYNLGKRLSLLLNIPIGLYKLNFESSRYKIPTKMGPSEPIRNVAGVFIPKRFDFRVGINYKILRNKPMTNVSYIT